MLGEGRQEAAKNLINKKNFGKSSQALALFAGAGEPSLSGTAAPSGALMATLGISALAVAPGSGGDRGPLRAPGGT